MSLNVYIGGDWKYNLTTTDNSDPRINVLDITKVTASGDELKLALRITGLPQWGNSMKFYGDIARHIVGNWFN